MSLTVADALVIIEGAQNFGLQEGMKPLSVVVLDAGGHPLAFQRAQGASAGRFEIARGKAYAAVMLGMGGHAIHARAEAQPYFISGLIGAFGGQMVPVPGGVLVRDGAGALIGAVGVTGCTSDNDARAAVAGIEAAGLRAEA